MKSNIVAKELAKLIIFLLLIQLLVSGINIPNYHSFHELQILFFSVLFSILIGLELNEEISTLWKWGAVSIVGFFIGSIGIWYFSLLIDYGNSELLTVFGYDQNLAKKILLGGVFGLVVGYFQNIFLKKDTRIKWNWMLISVLSFFLGKILYILLVRLLDKFEIIDLSSESNAILSFVLGVLLLSPYFVVAHTKVRTKILERNRYIPIFLFLSVLVLGVYGGLNWFYAYQQESIDMQLFDIVELLEEHQYQVENVDDYTNIYLEEHPYLEESLYQIISFELEDIEITAVSLNSWMSARISIQRIINSEKIFRPEDQSSFIRYGNLVLQFHSPDQDFADEILLTIKQE